MKIVRDMAGYFEWFVMVKSGKFDDLGGFFADWLLNYHRFYNILRCQILSKRKKTEKLNF